MDDPREKIRQEEAAALLAELEFSGAPDVSRNAIEQAIAIELRVLSRLAMVCSRGGQIDVAAVAAMNPQMEAFVAAAQVRKKGGP